MIDINEIRLLCSDETIRATQHFTDRIFMRNIEYSDIKSVIMSGEIIEDYPDDYPNPSVLILGYVAKQKPLHIVVGVSDDTLHLVTAYYPSDSKWEDDYKTRRKADK